VETRAHLQLERVHSNKIALLLGGSLATEILFATALGLFALGMGTRVSLVDLLVLNIGISLINTVIPIPGGIGVSELGLTVGLASAGMTEEAASLPCSSTASRRSTFPPPGASSRCATCSETATSERQTERIASVGYPSRTHRHGTTTELVMESGLR
jgi:lysylphosphatidylglycerol synthase-like protein